MLSSLNDPEIRAAPIRFLTLLLRPSLILFRESREKTGGYWRDSRISLGLSRHSLTPILWHSAIQLPG